MREKEKLCQTVVGGKSSMDRDFIKKSLSIYQDEGGVTPFGAKCNIYTGNLNQSLPLRNDFKQKDPEKQEEKTTWQKIVDWFSSWSCSCDCKSCIDNESEINLKRNVSKPQNITTGE